MNGHPRSRRGVILLVVLGMLALFMMIAVSFVVSSSADKTAAMASVRAEQLGDPYDALIKTALLQVVRGARGPNSVVGPHSLLEDMYGEREAVVGVVQQAGFVGAFNKPTASNPTNGSIIELRGMVSFGPDRHPGLAFIDDQQPSSTKGQVDDVYESIANATTATPSTDDYLLGNGSDGVDGYYTGRVLTMLSGPAANQSTRIIRWWYSPPNMPIQPAGQWVMWIKPFEKLDYMLPLEAPGTAAAPSFPQPVLPLTTALTAGAVVPPEKFLINGRPFNGAGFGYNPTNPTSNPFGLNNLSWATMMQTTQGDMVPFALAPNPTDRMYRDYLNDRLIPGIPGNFPVNRYGVDADEDYDAPDYNNLALAARLWNPALQGGIFGKWEVRVPSFHRPELVNYAVVNGQSLFGQQAQRWDKLPAGQGSGQSSQPRIRQRFILRPDPQDHVFTDTNGNGAWDMGEGDWSGNSYFDAVNGPWDVDNDGDGDMDSVWVDFGFPIQTGLDGTQYKPLVAVLCLDMDGRLNLNAHGNASQYKFVATSPNANTPFLDSSVHSSIAANSAAWNSQTDEVVMLGTARHGSTGTSNGPTNWILPEPIPGPYAGNTEMINWNFGTAAISLFPKIGTGGLVQIPVGMGYSPADVNLAPLLGYPYVVRNSGVSPLYYYRYNPTRWLYEGRYDGNGNPQTQPTLASANSNLLPQLATIEGKYGERFLTNPQNPAINPNSSPNGAKPKPGITYQWNASNGHPLADYPGDDNRPVQPMYALPTGLTSGAAEWYGNYYEQTLPSPQNITTLPTTNNPVGGSTNPSYPAMPGRNASPIDPNGRLVVGLDFRGQPFYANSAPLGTNELVDDPWELDLSIRTSRQGFVTPSQTLAGQAAYNFNMDNPFTPGELEAVLRQGDNDQQAMERRLVTLLGLGNTHPMSNLDFRNRVTTDSWDVPCPNITPTPEIIGGLTVLGYPAPATNLSIADLVRGKLAAVDQLPTPVGTGGQTTPQVINQRTQVLLGGAPNPATNTPAYFRFRARAISPDLVRGLRMDINRPFGDGFDNSTAAPGLGTVDEPGEIVAQPVTAAGVSLLNVALLDKLWVNKSGFVGFDANWDGVVSPDDIYARQEFAKQLFTLMMLMTDTKYLINYPSLENINGNVAANVAPNPTLNNTTPPNLAGLPLEFNRQLATMRIAQWAVNAVDFRDRDAIMTGFEIDLHPFYDDDVVQGSGVQNPQPGTWDVDGDLTTVDDANAAPGQGWRAVVWGMEYPELLITETLAFHDKATANTDQDNNPLGGAKVHAKRPMAKNNEQDYDDDQARMPTGSLFIELYCPGRPNTPTLVTPTANSGIPAVGSNGGPPSGTLAVAPFNPGPAAPYRAGSSSPPNTPYAPNLPYYPLELYDTTTKVNNNGNGGSLPKYGALDLARIVPVTKGGSNDPVWRLVATPGIRKTNPGAPPYSITDMFRQRPESTSLQPSGNPGNPLNIDVNLTLNSYFPTNTLYTSVAPLNPAAGQSRYICFTNAKPTSGAFPPTSLVFYNQSAAWPMLLEPGCYAVAGPHRAASTPQDVTWGGYYAVPATPPANKWNVPKFMLQPQAAPSLVAPFKLNSSGTSATAPLNYPGVNKVKNPLGIPLAAAPIGAPKAAAPMGLNISEPDRGYAALVPGYIAPNLPTTYPATATSTQSTALDHWSQYPDIPFDMYNTEPWRVGPPVPQPTPLLSMANLNYPDYSTILLQRLADPTQPWHPASNPYITIDWMPVDLSVYNGSATWGNGTPATPGDTYAALGSKLPQTMGVVRAGPNMSSLKSRQRGPRVPNSTIGFNTGTWAMIPPNSPGWPISKANPTAVSPPNFTEAPLSAQMSDDPPGMPGGPTPPQPSATGQPQDLYATLGFLNEGYGIMNPVGGTLDPSSVDTNYLTALSTSRYPNCPAGLLLDYVGDPQRPFPWLSWNNRPYANAMELLLVPASTPSRLGWEFTYKTQYTDGVVASRFGNGPGSNALVDSHYSPLRNPPWNWIGPNIGGVQVANASVQSSISNFPPLQSQIPNVNVTPALPKGGSPFGHLLNFFSSNAPPSPFMGNDMVASQASASNFHRIFEYVHVPSRFSGTDELLTPSFFGPPVMLNQQIGTGIPPNGPPLGDFAAPHNRISKYREPGRINLNTMFDRDLTYPLTTTNPNLNPVMWQALTNDSFRYSTMSINTGLPGLGIWDNFIASRWLFDPRGPDRMWGTQDDPYAPGATPGSGTPALNLTNQQLLALGNNMPTFFPNPFRSYCTNYPVPVIQLRARFKPNAITPSSPVYAPFYYADSNLLRRADPDTRWPSEPMFVNNSAHWLTTTTWVGNASPTNGTNPAPGLPPNPAQKMSNEYQADFMNTDRNPFFRYQPLQKLGGSTTSRSNVYAIWVTVGYFEVQRISPQQMKNNPNMLISNPDGYQLVREMGADSGTAKRHRGFAIVDRTTPVGFIRGENFNVDKVFLINRVIE